MPRFNLYINKQDENHQVNLVSLNQEFFVLLNKAGNQLEMFNIVNE